MAKRNPLDGPVFYTDRELTPLDGEYCGEVVKHVHQRMHPRYSLIIIIFSAIYLPLLVWFMYSFGPLAPTSDGTSPFLSNLFYAGAKALMVVSPAFIIGAIWGIARGWTEVSAVFLSGGLLYAKRK